MAMTQSDRQELKEICEKTVLSLEDRIDRLRELIRTAKAKMDELVHEQQLAEARLKHQTEVRSRTSTLYLRENGD